MLFEIILLLFIIFGLYNLHKYQQVWKYSEKLPGPRAYPIVGNAIQVGNNPVEYLKNLMKWWREYGCNIMRVWIGMDLYVVITDPKDIETILSSTTLLKKGSIYDVLRPWLGDGLLTSSGSKWHKRRKIITPSFHFKILVDFLDVMNRGSTKLIGKLKEKAATGETFDVQQFIHLCTFDIICETAMGVEMNALDDPNSEIVKAYQHICYTMQKRIFEPLQRYDATYVYTKDYQMQKKSLDIIQKFTNDVIEKRRKFVSDVNHSSSSDKLSNGSADLTNIKERKAFLDTIMNATIDGKPLTLEEIAEEVSTFAFEGHDTTKSGISFAIYLLSRHHHIQQKVYEEQIEIFGDDTDRAPTYQEIQDMKYMEMFVKEAQRVYPSVPFIARATTEYYNLNGRIIPPNTNMVLFLIAMGYNEKFFEDPFRIDPERFIPSKREHANPYDYVPFSAGPRNCVGQKFAMLEMKTVLSKIVRNFEILHPVNDCCSPTESNKESHQNHTMSTEPKHMWDGQHNRIHDPVLSAILTLQSDNGIHIRLRARHTK